MVRKLALTFAVLAGLILIAVGTRRWLDYRAARNVVTAFIVGLRDGQPEDVLNLLDPSQRRFVESRLEKKDEFWTPTDDFTYRIIDLEISGNKAISKVHIERGGFVIEPWFHLKRMESGSWKIRQIDHTDVDPRWNDLKEDRARASGEQLAEELREALKDSKGVSIERHNEEK